MEYLIPPWQHQRTAIERAQALPYFAFFFEMGAGKTMAAINTLRHKINQGKKQLRTIIFCPPIVVSNWKDEFRMHSKIKPERIVLLQGPGKKRFEDFKKAIDRPHEPIFVTNYEALLLGGFRNESTKKYVPGPLYQAMADWKPEALFFDESHRLKNYKAERSKQAERLANPKDGPRPFVALLSGSPVLNSPMDLFFQYLIMDGGATFGKNFFMFRARYFVDKNAGMPKDRYFPNWIVREGAVEEINHLIFRAGMRVTKEECMDLPEELSITVPCEMTPLQTKNYKEMKRDFITFVDENPASANLAIVKALRLMQITSGFLALNPQGLEDDAAKVVYPKTPKTEALKELLEELTPHSKVIVWAVWKENYAVIRAICEELGVAAVEVTGQVSRAQQDAAVVRFKSDPTARVFIGHPGSGGIGINLTCAPFSIFFSRTFSLEHWLQARARNHRGGQREKVTHYDLVCKDTIDELVQAKLATKNEMSENLLGDISLAIRSQAH